MYAKAFAIAILALTVGALSLSAQANTSTILGTVTDPTRAVVPGAKVTVTNVDTGVAASTVTDALGNYATRFLRFGPYRVEVEAAGFKKLSREGIDLQPGRELRVDLVLELGAVTESLGVVASAPVLETETGALGTTIQTKEVSALPIATRDVRDLALLIPGVIEYGYGTGVLRTRISSGGTAEGRDPVYVDGGRSTAHVWGDVPIIPNPDVVQEVGILTNAFSAEYGEAAGSITMTTTKSGTNQFRGTVYWFFKNDKLNAGNFFTHGRRVMRYNQMGANIGGPILRNKAFFFFNHTETRDLVHHPYTSQTVPLPAFKQGDFSRVLNYGGVANRYQLYDPSSGRLVGNSWVRDPFAANRIPLSVQSKAARKIQEFYPNPTLDTPFQNYSALARRPYNQRTPDIKLDYNVTGNDRAMLRYGYLYEWSEDSSPFPNPLAGGPGSGTGVALGIIDHPCHFGTLNYVRIFGPRATTSVNLSFFQMYPWRMPRGFGEVSTNDLGIYGFPNGTQKLGTPTIGIQDISGLGSAGDTLLIQNQQAKAIQSTTALALGRQTLKFGGEARLLRVDNWQPGSGNSAWNFNYLFTDQRGVSNTGFGYASFLLGLPYDMSYRFFPDFIRRRGAVYALFVQDDIRFSRRLTINLGLRWDAPLWFHELHDRSGVFDIGKGEFVQFGKDGFRRTPYENDWNNFGPRFGFAYDLFGNSRTVLRGGYGLSSLGTARATGFPVDPIFADASGGRYTTTDYVNWKTTLDLVPYQAAERTGRNYTAVTLYPAKNSMAYMQQWNLSVGHEIARILGEIAYVGTKGTHLPSGSYNLNEIPLRLAAEAKGQRIAPYIPYPKYPGGVTYNRWMGSSYYHSMQVKGQKRFAQGLAFTAAFTWQKTMNVEGSYRDAIDNRNLERGPTLASAPFRLSTSWSYTLPFGKNQRWLAQGPLVYPLGGWEISGMGVYQAGYPMTPGQSYNSSLTGGAQRPNRLRDGRLSGSEQTLNRWFDTSAFAVSSLYTAGNAGRGIILSPSRTYFNLSFVKRFTGFGSEKRNLEVRGEFFNLFNTPHFEMPNMTVDSPTAGRITSSYNERQVQLAMKFNF